MREGTFRERGGVTGAEHDARRLDDEGIVAAFGGRDVVVTATHAGSFSCATPAMMAKGAPWRLAARGGQPSGRVATHGQGRTLAGIPRRNAE
ncbi:MAG: hypothetical protein HXY18_20135 [Bryobacteraceae bacterium]|nr:hypothetical protein [Bryobacteraceae bacterium]